MKPNKKLLRTLVWTLLACLLVSCAPAMAEEEPLVVTMYLGCGVVEFPPDGNEIEKMIEDYTGVDMRINAYSGTVLHEMMPTLIASVYGMNVALPMEHHPDAFWVLMGLGLISVWLVMLYWRHKNW